MKFKGWPKVKIMTDEGQVDAIAPSIISESRATDIPSFYPEKFFQNLKKNYTTWTNPFNQVKQYVSFENVRVIVFWTKNAGPIIPYLEELNKRRIHYYFTFTMNDYEVEGLEPNLPPLLERVETFKRLSQLIGKDRVIWRFDPLILSEAISVDTLLKKIERVGNLLHDYTSKLVFSFVDISEYRAVGANLRRKGSDYREFDKKEKAMIAKGIQALNEEWRLELASCCEDVDLSSFGVHHNRCIDDELMVRLFKDDGKLMEFLGTERRSIQTTLYYPPKDTENPLKDKGQRKACGCIVSKDIGEYNTCGHLCTYCYANHSEAHVKANLKKKI